MKTVVVPVNQDGTITLPEDVRQRLVGGKGDAIEFIIRENGRIEVRPHLPALVGVFGPMPGLSTEVPSDRNRTLTQFAALSNNQGFTKWLSR